MNRPDHFQCVSSENLQAPPRRPTGETAQAESDLLPTELGSLPEWAKKLVGLLDNAVADGCDAGEVVWLAQFWRAQQAADKESPLELARAVLETISDPRADLPNDGREIARIYEDLALEALMKLDRPNPTEQGTPHSKAKED